MISKAEFFFERMAKICVDLRTFFFLTSLLISSLVGYGSTKLVLDTDGRVFMGHSNPDKQALDNFENEFAKDDNLILLIKPNSGDIFEQSTLRLIGQITEEFWQLPHVRMVGSITNFPAILGTSEGLIVRELIENPSDISQEDIDFALDYASNKVELRGIRNSNNTATAVTVLFSLPGIDQALEIPEIMAEVYPLVESYKKEHPDIIFQITGSVPIGEAFAMASAYDVKTLIPIMLLLLLISVVLILKIFSGAIHLIVISIASASMALGGLGWSGLALNSATAIAPLMVIAISIASTVHVLTSVRRSMSKTEVRAEWAFKALSQHGLAICVACTTTAVGFLSLNFSISPAFQQLGNMVAFGVIFTCIFTFTMLPFLIGILPEKARKSPTLIDKAIEGLANFVVRFRWQLLCVMPIIIIVATMGLFKLKFEDDFLRYFDQGFDVRVATDSYEGTIGGLNALDYPISTETKDGINSVSFLKDLDDFTVYLRKQPEVSGVRSISDIIKRLHMSLNANNPAFYTIPENDELASQLLFLYELSLGYGADLTDQINVDRSSVRITAFVPHTTTAKLRDLDDRIQTWFDNTKSNLKTPVTGQSYVYTMISTRDVPSMFKGTLLALVGISFLLLILMQNIKLGLITLIPNLFPGLIAFGLWGHFIGNVTLAVSVVIAMTLGIVVDDTVHFMLSYAKAKKKGLSANAAVQKAFKSVGSALTITTIALVLGFAVLSSSGFAVNRDMGKLTVLTLSLALVIDFLFLPPLLMWLDRIKGK